MSGSLRSKSWRQRWKLTGSLRWPQSMSVSTRFTNTKPLSISCEELDRPRDPFHVRLRRARLVDILTGEDVADLADAVHGAPRVADRGQVVRPRRLEREVVSVRRSLVVTRLARERTRDHAPDGVAAAKDLARHPASFVELLERDRVLVRCDLEDRVGGRVDDPLPGLLVLLAELLDDLRARGGSVADDAPSSAVHERVDHVVREPVRIRRERRRRDDPHHLPVPGGRVLPFRALEQPTRDRRRSGLRWAPLERHDVPEAQRLHVRQVETADGPCDVPECVGALVPVLGGVGQLSRPDRVEDDHARAGHLEGRRRSAREYVVGHGAILRRRWTRSWDSSCSCSTSSAWSPLPAS